MITIATHGTNFHSDDIFAVATLLTLLKIEGYSLNARDDSKKIKVIRTLDPEVYGKADYVVDIGGIYNVKKNRFDHHQQGGADTRVNGVPYASFGLVWKTFGKKLAGTAYAAEWVDTHIVQGIDAMDSGMFLYKPILNDIHPFLFEEYFSTACDVVKGQIDLEKKDEGKKQDMSKVSAKYFDKEFMRLVSIAEDVLRVFITKSKQKESIKKIAAKAYNAAKDKRVIISDIFIPTRFDEFKSPEYIEPLVFVYPDLRGNWSAKTVPTGEQSYESRILFPESWRGKRDGELEKESGVEGAVFCHNSGFLLVAKTKASILELIAKVVK